MNETREAHGAGCPEAHVTGTVFNLQRCSFHDGPGIRTTVFLKGCPLRCPWCHNPEGIAAAPEVMLNLQRCLGCGSCGTACPRAQGPLGAGSVLGRDGCRSCQDCIDACPTGARTVVGRPLTVGGILAEVVRDRLVYEESGGGVTFSGGEPLTQPEFLLACLGACTRAGIHTAVDTCGAAPREVVVAVARAARLLLWDIKHTDPKKHLRTTGAPLEPILDNLDAAAEVGVPIWLRIPLVPGFNDDEPMLATVASLARRLPSIRKVSLLPYHRTGTSKRSRLGRSGAAEHPTPNPERMRDLAAALATSGCETTIGG